MGYRKLFIRNAAYAAALSLVVLLFKYLDNELSAVTSADLLLMLVLVTIGVFLYTLAQVWITSRQKHK